MKVCSKCELKKDESEFYVRYSRPYGSGLQSQCKLCLKAYRLSPIGRASAKRATRTFLKTQNGLLSQRNGCRRRRERHYQFDLRFTRDDERLVYERFDHQCFRCGSTQQLEIDHHYPLSKGYGLTIHNAVLLCKLCNTAKNNRMPNEFYTQNQLRYLNMLLK